MNSFQSTLAGLVVVVVVTSVFWIRVGFNARSAAVERAFAKCEQRCDCNRDPRKKKWVIFGSDGRMQDPPTWQWLFGVGRDEDYFEGSRWDGKPIPESINLTPDEPEPALILAPARNP